MPGSHPITNGKPRVAGWQRSQAAPLPWPVHPHEQAATPRKRRAARLGCLWGFRAKRGQRGVKSALPHPPRRPTLQRPMISPGGRFQVGGDGPGWAGGRGHPSQAPGHRSKSKRNPHPRSTFHSPPKAYPQKKLPPKGTQAQARRPRRMPLQRHSFVGLRSEGGQKPTRRPVTTR